MKKKSIFKQLLFPIIAIVCVMAVCLTVSIAVVFKSNYEEEIYERDRGRSQLVSGNIAAFLDGAYEVTEELSVNPSILSMETGIQTPILEDCVRRNPYLELLYIQGTDGMQTGRSSGELADRSTRWWFVQTMEEQKAFISKSYYSVNTGMPCASIFFPMYRDAELIGIFAVDLKLDYLQSLIEEFSDVDNGEYSFVIDGEGVVVAHPDSTQIEELYNYRSLTKTVSKKDSAGQPLLDADGAILTEEQSIEISADYQKIIADVMAGNTGSRKIENEGKNYFVSYASIPLKGESDSWSVITLRSEASAMAVVYRLYAIAAILSAVIIGIAILVIAMLARRLTSPIVSITDLIKNASDGDFSVQAVENSQNEIGTLSKSFNKMTGKISAILTRITSISEEVLQSAGQLRSIDESADSLNQAVQEILDGTSQQNTQVEQVVSQAEIMEEEFGQLQEKSGLLLQDAQNTILSGENGMRSVAELRERSEAASDGMSASFEQIQVLEQQSRKISGILGTIDEISSQTGLLALNASIEAARAGEHGRGFAIVAESIGKLASDSTAATADIEKIIDELCRNISDTVSNIDAIRESVQGQMQAADQVEETFMDFRSLAEKTKESVRDMEELICGMHEGNRSVVNAVEQIRDISANTAKLTDQVSDALEKQLQGIRSAADRIDHLSMVSSQMEQEMTKFKLGS